MDQQGYEWRSGDARAGPVTAQKDSQSTNFGGNGRSGSNSVEQRSLDEERKADKLVWKEMASCKRGD